MEHSRQRFNTVTTLQDLYERPILVTNVQYFHPTSNARHQRPILSTNVQYFPPTSSTIHQRPVLSTNVQYSPPTSNTLNEGPIPSTNAQYSLHPDTVHNPCLQTLRPFTSMGNRPSKQAHCISGQLTILTLLKSIPCENRMQFVHSFKVHSECLYENSCQCHVSTYFIWMSERYSYLSTNSTVKAVRTTSASNICENKKPDITQEFHVHVTCSDAWQPPVLRNQFQPGEND